MLRAHVLGRNFHIVTHNGVLTAITDESAAENATAELKEDVMTLLRVLLTLDAETAGCSVEADKVKILRAVHLAVGIPQLSIVLQALLSETAVKVMRAVGAFYMSSRLRAVGLQAHSIAWSDRSALHCAAQESAAAVDRVLTDSLGDLEARDSTGATPLVLAARFNHTDTLERLVEAGANVESRDENKRTPIIWASWNGHTATVEKLASMGADVNAATEDGRTGLMLAAMAGHTATVEALAQLGADVNAARQSGSTGLILAAWAGHTATVEVLAQLGADVNAANKNGNTGLMHAAGAGHAATVEALAQLGADVDAANEDGLTAKDWANNTGHTNIAERLHELHELQGWR